MSHASVCTVPNITSLFMATLNVLITTASLSLHVHTALLLVGFFFIFIFDQHYSLFGQILASVHILLFLYSRTLLPVSLLSALFTPNCDYCNSLYNNLSNSEINNASNNLTHPKLSRSYCRQSP